MAHNETANPIAGAGWHPQFDVLLACGLWGDLLVPVNTQMWPEQLGLLLDGLASASVSQPGLPSSMQMGEASCLNLGLRFSCQSKSGVIRMDILLQNTCFNGVSVKTWGSNCVQGSINFEKNGAPVGRQVSVTRAWVRHRGRGRA